MKIDEESIDLIKKIENVPSEIANLNLDEFSKFIEKKESQDKLKLMHQFMFDSLIEVLKDPIKKILFNKILDFLNNVEKNKLVLFNETFKKIEDDRKIILLAQELERLEQNIKSYNQKNPDVYLKQICESYHSFYEIVVPELKYYAEKIENKQISSNGDVIRILKEYEKGKYKELFEFFNNHIRNAIGHKTFHLNKDKNVITFIDRNKLIETNFMRLNSDINCMFSLSELLLIGEFFKLYFKN